MSDICEWDQINEKIQYRAVQNLERTEQSKIVQSQNSIINLMILWFQNFQFKQVKQTLTKNLIVMLLMFIQENEQKISISHHLSSKSRLTGKK